ncbi:PREDICTED: uncharacterized protein LOC108366005 [Rhagoletis zephyria]|uniref:uncharacterized protein LOC108366005 n=1 Tax=Rhagoletis zephyria TaxID=28612 RepID=UPI0008114896|nr:PREDICTED: uncharacterized protein LOC108366005 [Rhagoletis zephyria]
MDFDQEANIFFIGEEIITQNVNEENHLESLRQIICGKMEFGENVLQRPLDCCLDVEGLYLIKDEDVNEIFPQTMLGMRIKFRERLSHWRQNEARTISSLSLCKSGQNCSQDSQNSTKFTQTSLDVLLNSTPKGNSILQQYKEKLFLLDVHREALVNIILNYFSERSLPITMKDIVNFSEQIVAIFPTENMRFYCNRREGKNPTGKLYDKATNVRRKLNKQREAEVPNDTEVLKNKDSASYSNDQNAITKKLWLAHNMETWSDVVKKWDETIEIRRQDIFDGKVNIFADWPLLKHTLGYTLIEIDFTAKYTDNTQNLINDWRNFKRVIIPYMRDKIKDTASNNMLLMIDDNVDSDSADCIITLLMHSILKPPLVSINKTPGSKRLKWKPSICDAQNVTVLLCECVNDYQRKYDEMKCKAMERGISLQPQILVIGKELSRLESYYIVFDNILYKVPTFVRALDILFKLFHVLNFEYPIEAKYLFDFIEKYFFKFECSVNPNILLLINYLESTNKLSN